MAASMNHVQYNCIIIIIIDDTWATSLQLLQVTDCRSFGKASGYLSQHKFLRKGGREGGREEGSGREGRREWEGGKKGVGERGEGREGGRERCNVVILPTIEIDIFYNGDIVRTTKHQNKIPTNISSHTIVHIVHVENERKSFYMYMYITYIYLIFHKISLSDSSSSSSGSCSMIRRSSSTSFLWNRICTIEITKNH